MINEVKEHREKWLGGSDLPAVLGYSPYKSRYDLVYEKAGKKTPDAPSNMYIDFGVEMEDKIREAFNSHFGLKWEPITSRVSELGIRCNLDGYCAEDNSVLEIKTATDVEKALTNKGYMAQLLLYMLVVKADKGYLCVYHNDEFDTEFVSSRMDWVEFTPEQLIELLNLQDEQNVFSIISKFWDDVKLARETNELIAEQEFLPQNVQEVADKVREIEVAMSTMKEQYETYKQSLLDQMTEHNIKQINLLDGTKITRVDPTVSITKKWDDDALKLKLKDEVGLYQVSKETNRKGSVRITLGK